MNVAFEDVRIAPKNESFDDIIQAAIDELDDGIADMLEITPVDNKIAKMIVVQTCLLYTSPSPRDLSTSRMPSSA